MRNAPADALSIKDIPLWLSRKQAASYLTSRGVPMTEGTLANVAANNNAGRGPPFYVTRGFRVTYNRDELALWATMQFVRVE